MCEQGDDREAETEDSLTPLQEIITRSLKETAPYNDVGVTQYLRERGGLLLSNEVGQLLHSLAVSPEKGLKEGEGKESQRNTIYKLVKQH